MSSSNASDYSQLSGPMMGDNDPEKTIEDYIIFTNKIKASPVWTPIQKSVNLYLVYKKIARLFEQKNQPLNVELFNNRAAYELSLLPDGDNKNKLLSMDFEKIAKNIWYYESSLNTFN